MVTVSVQTFIPWDMRKKKKRKNLGKIKSVKIPLVCRESTVQGVTSSEVMNAYVSAMNERIGVC